MSWSPPPWWAALLEVWRRAAIVGRRSCRLPVHPSGGPGVFSCACLLSAGLLELPAAMERATKKRRENAVKISSDFSGEGFYACGLSFATWYINAPL